MIKVTKNPKDTEKLAGFLLNSFLKKREKKALVIALEGELGAGKTVFAKGLARAFKVKAKIKSPTFTLMKSYKLRGENFSTLYHLDCYRLRDHRDLEVMGIKDIINEPGNIVLIEWSDRVKEILPKKHIKIHIDHVDSKTRKIEIS